MVYQVKLEVFEGPLDLLLKLIDKEEVSIYDIPISKITEQYIDYLRNIKESELETASEFIVLAATLLLVKSKMLLPSEPCEPSNEDLPFEDPRRELAERLSEYKIYHEIALVFKKIQEEGKRVYTRESGFGPKHISKSPGAASLKDISLSDLVNKTYEIWKRRSPETVKKLEKIQEKKITIEEKIEHIFKILKEKNSAETFHNFLSSNFTRTELIVTFIALLELARLKLVSIEQSELFKEIKVEIQHPEE